MALSNHDSYTSLHAFLTAVLSFLKKEQQFADKNIQNTVFATLQKNAPLSYVSDDHDFLDAIHSLYDLISKVLYFRNQEDDAKLISFLSSLIACVSRTKHISDRQASDDIILFITEFFFKNISTDGIPDLDPRWALYLLKLVWVLPLTFKFSSSVGRGKFGNNTTFDSWNTRLYLEIHNHPVLTYENIATITQRLSTQNLDMNKIAIWEDRAKTSCRFVIDHHHRYCQSTSITHMVYIMLLTLGKWSSNISVLQRFVAFIDMADDMYYQLASVDDRISIWSLLGVQRELFYNKLIDIDDIYCFFEENPWATWLEVLTDDQLDSLSHGKVVFCKQVIAKKTHELASGKNIFLNLKLSQTFFHHTQPFLRLIRQTIPRVLDVTSKYWYGLLQLNQKTWEIKIHNVTWFDDGFLASLVHPAIKVMKWRNIFIKANEDISDDSIQSCLLDLWCPQNIVTNMISTRHQILSTKK